MKDIIKTVGSIVIVSSIFALGMFSLSSTTAIPDVTRIVIRLVSASRFLITL